MLWLGMDGPTGVLAVILACVLLPEITSTCPLTTPDESRRNCWPWPDGNQATCESFGCVWCPSETPGVPWCSMNEEVCPSLIPEASRQDCHPDEGASKESCRARRCIWCVSTSPGVPWCFADPSISQIYDPANARYEVPIPISPPDVTNAPPQYTVTVGSDPLFYIQVVRRSTGEVLFDTSTGGLQFADQFIQFSAKLASPNVYGFGESEHPSLRHEMNWRRWPMWARDEPVKPLNIYSVHPFFTAFDSQGHMFGCLILNSNAMEVEMTPAPGLVYRTSGGILDLFFYLGPTPENVIQQYTRDIGRPMIPPYWALGFHLSRYGYNTLDNMRGAVDRMRQYDIPLDVQHGDIDTMDRYLSFTYDQDNFAGLPEFVRHLKQQGTKYIQLLNPFVNAYEPNYGVFSRGQQADVWLKESDGVTNAEAKCWPLENVFYSDFSKEATKTWWHNECRRWHDVVEYDGLWIDMNEPASFVPGSVKSCYNNRWNLPLYKPRSLMGDLLYEKTLCTDYLMAIGRRYDVHSLYGLSSAEPTLRASQQATGKRGLVINRSSFPGMGQHAGRWLGDNNAHWNDLRFSIIGLLEFNFFGITFVGADICGYFSDTQNELCERWMQLGAFYTFSRNHNGIGYRDQDPGAWPQLASISRAVLHVRYTYLPYLYTLFYQARVHGNTVVRPLHHEFPRDTETYGVDRQFLWGPAFMISPVLEQDARSVNAYIPDARWYDLYNGAELGSRLQIVSLPAPLDKIPLLLRGGYILPTQQPASSTQESRNKPMGLTVVLNDANMAAGELFWDDGDSIETYENGIYFLGSYAANDGILTGSITHDGYSGMNQIFTRVTILGVTGAPLNIVINGATWNDWVFNTTTKVLEIRNMELLVKSSFIITWG